KRGAHLLNYTELLSFNAASDHVTAQIKNQDNGDTVIVQARVMINATGSWIDQVRQRSDDPLEKKKLVDRVAGGHMDITPLVTDHSLYITAADGRLVFVLKRE